MKSHSSRPDISVFLASLRGGGAERIMLTIANELASRGFQIDLVLANAEGPYLTEINPSIQLIDLRAKRVLLSLPFMIRYLQQNKPTAILSALPHINIVAILARFFSGIDSKVVLTEHNTLTKSVENSTTRRGRWLPFLMRIAYPFADNIVAVSTGVADDLATRINFSRSRIIVIYNPVVTETLIRQLQGEIPHRWFSSEQPPVILGVGRLTAAKNFSHLIHAFSIVRKQRKARLVILGEGAERPSLETLIRQLGLSGEVELPGFTDNPYIYMKRSRVFVLSSLWEGLPTVLIEALFCGTQVVSTDCPSGPREILEEGKWGALVPIEDVDALAFAILEAIDHRAPSPNSDTWNKYTVDTIIAEYETVLFGPQQPPLE